VIGSDEDVELSFNEAAGFRGCVLYLIYLEQIFGAIGEHGLILVQTYLHDDKSQRERVLSYSFPDLVQFIM
jgi:hypothetical protein